MSPSCSPVKFSSRDRQRRRESWRLHEWIQREVLPLAVCGERSGAVRPESGRGRCDGAMWPRGGARSDSFTPLLPVPREALPPRRRQPLPAGSAAAAARNVPRCRRAESRSISSLSRKCPERKQPPSGGSCTGSDGPPRPSRRGRCSQPALRSAPRLRPPRHVPPPAGGLAEPRGAVGQRTAVVSTGPGRRGAGRPGARPLPAEGGRGRATTPPPSPPPRSQAARQGPVRPSREPPARYGPATLLAPSAGPGAERGEAATRGAGRPPRGAGLGRIRGEAGSGRAGRPSSARVPPPAAGRFDGATCGKETRGRARRLPAARRLCARLLSLWGRSLRSGPSAVRGWRRAARLGRLCWEHWWALHGERRWESLF